MTGIGIITYNRLFSLIKCLDTVRRYTPTPYQLIIADDGSSDGTVEYCKTHSIPFVTGPNMGIAANKNRALLALQDCSHIFLLEDDTRILRPAWLTQYIRASQDTSEHHFLYNRRRDPEDLLEEIHHHTIIYHYTSNAFMMFLTQQVLALVGGFDLRFGRYGFEHYDFTYRIWKAGLIRHPNPHLLSAESYLKLDLSAGAVLDPIVVKALIGRNHRVLAQSLKEADEGYHFRPIAVPE